MPGYEIIIRISTNVPILLHLPVCELIYIIYNPRINAYTTIVGELIKQLLNLSRREARVRKTFGGVKWGEVRVRLVP